MAKRIGSVIVFKAGVSKEQAAKALATLAEVIDFPKDRLHWEKTGQIDPHTRRPAVKMVKRPFKVEDAVHEYNDEHGQPCFYIP